MVSSPAFQGSKQQPHLKNPVFQGHILLNALFPHGHNVWQHQVKSDLKPAVFRSKFSLLQEAVMLGLILKHEHHVFCVITSYSIHYTKLYELQERCNMIKEQLFVVKDNIKSKASEIVIEAKKSGKARITSYNVCYTKLLRQYYGKH